ncbi:MAG: hypothetical protein IPJ47_12825 [Anaerolineales bacterium]|nr:hypothetical protein [Anaerolineales bacterium]
MEILRDYLTHIEKKQRHEIRLKMRRAARSDRNSRFADDLPGDIELELNAFFFRPDGARSQQSDLPASCARCHAREQMTAGLRAA